MGWWSVRRRRVAPTSSSAEFRPHLAPRGASHVIKSIGPFLTNVQTRLPHLACGLVLASLALTPSLVPRPTLFQGFLAGLWFMIGFGLGNPVRNFGRWLRMLQPGRLANFTPSLRSARILRTVALFLLFAYLLIYASIVVHWQNEVRALVEMDPVDGAAHVVFVLAALVTMVLCWGIARGISSIASLAARRVANAGGLCADSCLDVVAYLGAEHSAPGGGASRGWLGGGGENLRRA
ncbi:hypothetical protein CGQ24_09105 [Arthrobacter sp. 7749]|nr:hypothetical protein CGQ24_09105 [Arthrobacter sp. 7749]